MHPPSGRHAFASLAVAVLLAALAPLGPSFAGDGAEGFGRWQWDVGKCERNLEGQEPSRCGRVQVDQAVEGLLTIRFIASGPKRDGSNLLVFVGVLPKGQQPMRCRQGKCEPVAPVRAELSSVSESSFDGRGLAEGLPKAWPADGSCQVGPSEVSCEAKALSGERWRAQASF
ncbi:hypothetical protein [Cyanobium sp. ATX 6F1]|uniref:hypothetical protein n=1 Tax=Cyanobium sp. ATX 6F1 TaxID=2823702 RepID=UPI0020CE3351|nr:hypothetical protein [Cyanobium sp. ATX 6F1]MCP9917228.1 hypothetical protein [Cyanobium sp. ATX 6F1]